MDPEEALMRVKCGNERFATGQPLHPHETQEWRRQMVHHVRPFAAVLGCSEGVTKNILFRSVRTLRESLSQMA